MINHLSTYDSIDLIISKIDIIKNNVLAINAYANNNANMIMKEFKLNDRIWIYWLFTTSASLPPQKYLEDYNTAVINMMENLMPKYINVIRVEKPTKDTTHLKISDMHRTHIHIGMRMLNQLYVNIKVKRQNSFYALTL